MEDVKAEALGWLRNAVAAREAGVQDDKRHYERSMRAFDVERARTHAAISGMKLHHAMALLELLESRQHLSGDRER